MRKLLAIYGVKLAVYEVAYILSTYPNIIKLTALTFTAIQAS